ncbi:MAG TPA: hypothetical protein VD905_21295 [Flavobacteriales bacterium]|nr:hypothetical protein [Flavobacteriales bacterium]
MTQGNKQPVYNPWPAYFMILAGLCLIAAKLLNLDRAWTGIDTLKVCVGAAVAVFGMVRLIQKK